MLITGLYKDQNGNTFYKVKNSWNTDNIYDGYFFASAPSWRTRRSTSWYIRMPYRSDIRKKLGISRFAGGLVP